MIRTRSGPRSIHPSNSCRVIILETQKGHGVSFMQDRMEWHYLPLKEQDYQRALLEIEAQ